jgi:hypothetical protein
MCRVSGVQVRGVRVCERRKHRHLRAQDIQRLQGGKETMLECRRDQGFPESCKWFAVPAALVTAVLNLLINVFLSFIYLFEAQTIYFAL